MVRFPRRASSSPLQPLEDQCLHILYTTVSCHFHFRLEKVGPARFFQPEIQVAVKGRHYLFLFLFAYPSTTPGRQNSSLFSRAWKPEFSFRFLPEVFQRFEEIRILKKVCLYREVNGESVAYGRKR
ncbi:MAG TPA: hypothetical protein DEA96_08830 [Leptospiraceae bacterium]|nr:hypothetical protein [Spirochaetaceae bacterium]HBS05055.1 hypothetical protein [Leptospiraceae bacterium]